VPQNDVKYVMFAKKSWLDDTSESFLRKSLAKVAFKEAIFSPPSIRTLPWWKGFVWTGGF